MMLLLTAGCGDDSDVQPEIDNPSNTVTAIPVVDKPDVAPAPTALPTPTETVPSQNVGLTWSGVSLPTGEKGETCTSLTLTPDERAMVGPCDGSPTETELLANQAREWSDILARFAPFQSETPDEQLDFRGPGRPRRAGLGAGCDLLGADYRR